MSSFVCEKESFPKYEDGIEKLRHMNSRKGRHKVRLYKCDRCGNYHFTTVTKNLIPIKKKYPVKVEKQGSSKIKNVPGMSTIPRPSQVVQSKPLATQKLMSKEQAEALKRIIDSKNI